VIRDEILKVREEVLHALENNDKLNNVYFTDKDNTIDVDYRGNSYKIIIEKYGD